MRGRRLCSLLFAAFVVSMDPDTFAKASDEGSIDVYISTILDKLQESYDKRVRPNYGGVPVEVGVTMYLLGISSVSEVQMDFTVDFYFRQTWQDPRLSFRARPGVETLSVGSEFIEKLWVPDTFFVNEKKSYFHQATTSNEFLRIMTNGEVFRSIRLTITASCPMDLQFFPMDRQLCHIEIESFGYTMSDIRYKWRDGANSVGVASDVSLPQFKVLGHRQRIEEISLTTGNYSRLACEIQFVRSMGYYMIQIYIPSSLIVVISWVSFWLNRNASPARVSLGVTTVLTMTTLMSSTNSQLPKISYVKSIDVYLGTCFIMVFASLLEYAAVGYIDKRIQLRKARYMAVQKLTEQKTKSAAVEMPLPHDVSANIVKPTRSFGWPTAAGSTATLPAQYRGPFRDRDDGHSWSAVQHGPHMHEVRYKDPQSRGGNILGEGHINGRAYEDSIAGSSGASVGVPTTPTNPCPANANPIPPGKKIQKVLGITPSDIDKYSRILFPVCFVCFNLSYWIIYLHISDVLPDDLVMLKQE